MYSYNPTHYTANKAGKVLQHVFNMAEHIGRPLTKNECVHHIDRDRTNNDLANLQLLTLKEHVRLHCVEDLGTTYIINICINCQKTFETTLLNKRNCCSILCATQQRQIFKIDPSDLLSMVWSMPTTEVAKILGVSDVAIAKRCKLFNIPKPPRGYWAKVAAGVPVIT